MPLLLNVLLQAGYGVRHVVPVLLTEWIHGDVVVVGGVVGDVVGAVVSGAVVSCVVCDTIAVGVGCVSKGPTLLDETIQYVLQLLLLVL
jgi:hypothetical protein